MKRLFFKRFFATDEIRISLRSTDVLWYRHF